MSNHPPLLLTLNAADVAQYVLRQSEKTFRNAKARLIREHGFPPPLAIPGTQLWDRRELEAWLETMRRAEDRPRIRGGKGVTATAQRNEIAHAAAQGKRGAPTRIEREAAEAAGLSVKEYRARAAGGAA